LETAIVEAKGSASNRHPSDICSDLTLIDTRRRARITSMAITIIAVLYVCEYVPVTTYGVLTPVISNNTAVCIVVVTIITLFVELRISIMNSITTAWVLTV
jgi:hypothetical protein